jgi:hypothetical protein
VGRGSWIEVKLPALKVVWLEASESVTQVVDKDEARDSKVCH